MPNWKRVIVSGSSAHLNHVTASGHISGSSTSTGSFGDGRFANKVGIGENNPYPKLAVAGDIHMFNGWYTLQTISFGTLSSAPASNNTAAKLVVSSSTAAGAAKGEMQFWTNAGDSIGQRMVINKDGNVGIGTTDPGYKLHINGGNMRITQAGADAFISIDEGNASHNAYLDFGRGSQNWTLKNSGNFHIEDEGTSRFMVEVGGNVGIGTTGPLEKLHVASGSVLVTGAGEGYAFEAGAAANTLDDYEEGTWQPVYGTTGGSFTTMTMDILNASYTKIGRQVTVTGIIRTDSVDATGATGALTIAGLPFTALGSEHYGTVTVGKATLFASGEFPRSGYTEAGNTYIVLTERAAVDGTDVECGLDTLTAGVTANQNLLIFSAIYYAA